MNNIRMLKTLRMYVEDLEASKEIRFHDIAEPQDERIVIQGSLNNLAPEIR